MSADSFSKKLRAGTLKIAFRARHFLSGKHVTSYLENCNN